MLRKREIEMQERLIQAWRTRPRLIVGGAIGAVALVTLGAFALNGGGGRLTPGISRGLDIAVVAPTEPDIQPGSRMEVGALVNDLDTEALKAATDQGRAADDGDYYAEQPAYVGNDYEHSVPPPRTEARDQNWGDEGQRNRDRSHDDQNRADWGTVGGRGDRMGLGFDGPRPETGAEREARRGPPRPRPRVQYRSYSSRPTGDPGATFY